MRTLQTLNFRSFASLLCFSTHWVTHRFWSTKNDMPWSRHRSPFSMGYQAPCRCWNKNIWWLELKVFISNPNFFNSRLKECHYSSIWGNRCYSQPIYYAPFSVWNKCACMMWRYYLSSSDIFHKHGKIWHV